VQILVDIENEPDGRLTGVVTKVGTDEARSFSGKLELLNRIEELCRVHTRTDDETTRPAHLPSEH
jgi:hypothetical protein